MILNELVVTNKITTYIDITKNCIAKKLDSSSPLTNQNNQIHVAKGIYNPDSSFGVTKSVSEVFEVLKINEAVKLRGLEINFDFAGQDVSITTVLADNGIISFSAWHNNNPVRLEDFLTSEGVSNLSEYFIVFDFSKRKIEFIKSSEVDLISIDELHEYDNGLDFYENKELEKAVYYYLFEGFNEINIKKIMAEENERHDISRYLMSLNLFSENEHKNLGIYYQVPVDYLLAKIERLEKYQNLYNVLKNLEFNSLKNPLINQKNIGKNQIFYGVPGSGKSYSIRQEYILRENNHLTVTFHPEYSYYDFVGSIVPTLVNDKMIYAFNAGPFSRILKRAISDEANHYYLIIEEINRANASSVFGDLFQLLDRNNEGESEYTIFHKDIAKYVYGEENKKIYLPKNLSIIATMNTSDQNVFTLDTAFKRRFNLKYVKITLDEFVKNDFTLFNASYNNETRAISWAKFALAFNDYLLGRISDELYASEDKQLGPWFIKNANYTPVIFVEKVLRYIWDDVVKHEKQIFFNQKRFDDLIEIFEEETVEIEKIFNPEFNKILWMN